MKSFLLNKWIDRAYALEVETVRMLQSHKDDARYHTEISEKIKEYIEETKLHAIQLRQLLERKEAVVSGINSNIAYLRGMLRGMSTELMEDKVVRNIIDELNNIYTKIALYTFILAGARELEDEDTLYICGLIVHDETQMALWLQNHIKQMAVEAVIHDVATHQPLKSIM